MDENELDNIDDEEKYTDPSGRGSIDKSEPKNPTETEATIVVLVLGVLPDIIDFFSIGAFSFFSSAIAWPLTEYYFHVKNLKVPNIKKWMRGMNVGDVIPFVGALPLKTTGLVIAIYMAWHPESALTKAAKTAEGATGGAKKAPAGAATGLRQKAKEAIGRIRGKGGGLEPEEDESSFEMAYGKEKESDQKDIYETTREGAGGLLGPEEEAEAATFEEIPTEGPIPLENISQAVETEPVRGLTPKETPRGTSRAAKPVAAGGLISEATPEKEGAVSKIQEQEAEGKVGGAYEQEQTIMKGMESVGEIDEIAKEKPITIAQARGLDQIESSDNEASINLKTRKE